MRFHGLVLSAQQRNLLHAWAALGRLESGRQGVFVLFCFFVINFLSGSHLSFAINVNFKILLGASPPLILRCVCPFFLLLLLKGAEGVGLGVGGVDVFKLYQSGQKEWAMCS